MTECKKDEALETCVDMNVPSADTIQATVAQMAPAPAQNLLVIPQHVANNTLEFLKRVKMEGLEAFAFCEAYSTLQRFAGTANTHGNGVPFTGVLG